MTKVGMLYIATGPYKLFFDGYYRSFEEKFLPDYEKTYYVFTDEPEFFEKFGANVRPHKIDTLPWPLTTLLRFNYFLSIEDELNANDYLIFTNANVHCDEVVTPEEMLASDDEQGLFFTDHPGFYQRYCRHMPYDRNPKSTAFIPYHKGKHYVIGAFYGGKTKEFLELSRELRANIEKDLKNNVIAKWHDESQVNKYVQQHPKVRINHPGFVYHIDYHQDFPRKVSSVEKDQVFDVYEFKNSLVADENMTFAKKVKIILSPIMTTVGQYVRGDLLFLYHMIRYMNR